MTVFRLLAAFGALAASSIAAAQPTPAFRPPGGEAAIGGKARPSAPPSDRDAVAPPLEYRSAFSGYRAFDDAGPGSWREVNDRVREAAEQRYGHQHGGQAPAAAPPSTTPSGARK